MNLLTSILKNALVHPRRTAVIDDQRSYSYGGLALGAFYMRREIRKIAKTRHVGIMLPTSGLFPIAILGVWLGSKVAVPLNYLLSSEELEYVINDSDIDTIITVGPMLSFIGGENVIPENIKLIKLEEMKFKGVPPLAFPPKLKSDDTAVILYTSGTSGKPKGVVLTHRNLSSNVEAAIAHAGLHAKGTILGVLPQFHSFGLTILTLIPLRLGARVVYSARFVPGKIIGLMRKHKPDLFVAIPSMYGALLSVKSAVPEDFSSIKVGVSGGEPLSDAIYEQFLDRFNFKILEGYGLTETAPATNWATKATHKRHSVGPTLPGIRNFVVDENMNLLPANSAGEILIAGPNVMAGYYKNPKLTEQVIATLTPPGATKPLRVFKTGDIGYLDDDGYLFITGRKKEMLIIGGENVFPREIEEVLNHHPSIQASAVIGKQDDMRGEVPVAYVELNDDFSSELSGPEPINKSNKVFDPAAVRAYCREHLAPYKVPKEIHVVKALPRNPTGKILRRKLREQ